MSPTPPPTTTAPNTLGRQAHTSSASSFETPDGTPPPSAPSALPTSSATSINPASATSHQSSPTLPTSPLPPSSPSSSSNRFGLALNFMTRRPRGTSMGPSSPHLSGGGTSPSAELSPSPGLERDRSSGGGYGFPALRRTLSKRPGSSGSATSSVPGQHSGEVGRTRLSRSLSQPPAVQADLGGTSLVGRPPSSSGVRVDRPVGPVGERALPPIVTELAGTEGGEGGTTLAGSTPVIPGVAHRIRLVPHLESARSLHFDPIDRDVTAFLVHRIGRFTDRSLTTASGTLPNPDTLRIAFKSKVVSRGHAEVWCDDDGKFFIKDTKSSSGTFLNHIRLSGPGAESRAFPLKDGDILQLGVDYQGGTEEIYRCVKIKVELNRGWQRGMNSFNTAALAQLRALGGGAPMESGATTATAMTATPTLKAPSAAAASVTDCCICLFPVTVCQALFIAPCSHVTHFKCIRPLVNQNYPGFSCPLCRTYADLEADVEIDDPWEPDFVPAPPPETVPEEEVDEGEDDSGAAVIANGPAPTSRAPSIRPPRPDLSGSRRSSLQLTGPDGIAVPFAIAGHRRPSRPPSIVSTPLSEDVPSSSATQPIPMSAAQTEAALYASLNDAATPPNSTFLTHLADDTSFARFHAAHVSLDMALDKFTNSSEESEGSASGSGTGGGVGREMDAERVGEVEGKGKGKETGQDEVVEA